MSYRYQYGATECGSSLLSVLFVMSVGVSTSLLAAHGFQRMYERALLRGETKKIIGLLHEAKQISLLEYQIAMLSLRQDPLRLYAGVEENLRREISLSSRIQVTVPSQDILFYPGIVSTPARILLQLNEHICEVVLSLRGRVRSQCQ
ncbi:MAG: hypothetical protein ACO3XO_02285 [Bdellovibrionota bacterium]|jgi:hypothetical protein